MDILQGRARILVAEVPADLIPVEAQPTQQASRAVARGVGAVAPALQASVDHPTSEPAIDHPRADGAAASVLEHEFVGSHPSGRAEVVRQLLLQVEAQRDAPNATSLAVHPHLAPLQIQIGHPQLAWLVRSQATPVEASEQCPLLRGPTRRQQLVVVRKGQIHGFEVLLPGTADARNGVRPAEPPELCPPEEARDGGELSSYGRWLQACQGVLPQFDSCRVDVTDESDALVVHGVCEGG